MTWFIDMRASAVGGIPSAEPIAWNSGVIAADEDLARAAFGRNVVFGTHGFNVDRTKGVDCLSSLETLLDRPDLLFVGLLWAGDSRWAPVIDYPVEGDEAITSGNMLGPYIDRVFTGAASVSYISHSLGARMVLQTIRQSTFKPRHAILMASAIDDNCLVDEYADAATKIGSISVLASVNDEVLALAFPIGNLLGGIITRGDPYWHGALGRHGPAAPFRVNFATPYQIPDSWKFGHGSYLTTSIVLPQPFVPPVDLPLTEVSSVAPSPLENDVDGWRPDWVGAYTSSRIK